MESTFKLRSRLARCTSPPCNRVTSSSKAGSRFLARMTYNVKEKVSDPCARARRRAGSAEVHAEGGQLDTHLTRHHNHKNPVPVPLDVGGCLPEKVDKVGEVFTLQGPRRDCRALHFRWGAADCVLIWSRCMRHIVLRIGLTSVSGSMLGLRSSPLIRIATSLLLEQPMRGAEAPQWTPFAEGIADWGEGPGLGPAVSGSVAGALPFHCSGGTAH